MRSATIVGVLVLGAMSGCCCKPKPVPTPNLVGVLRVANNGLSPDEARAFYSTPEGSELFPLTWFLNMDSVTTGGRFAEHLDRFGLLFDAAPKDPWNLPIGLTVSAPEDLEQKMVGVNCAACHVGELQYGDPPERLRIDGAPNLFDIDLFYNDLISSAVDALEHPSKLIKMLFGRPDGSLDAVALAGLAAADPMIVDTLTRLGTADVGGLDPLRASGHAGDVALAEDLEAVIAADTQKFAADYADPHLHDQLVADLLLGRPDPAGPLPAIVPADPSSRLADLARQAQLYGFRERLRLLLARIQFLRNIARRNAHDTPSHFGRVDAFGFARNFLFGASYGYSDNVAPISYPYLWGFQKTKYLHWDGNTTSVLARNLGQALGVGAIVTPSRPYVTTVIVPNLYDLEQLAYKLHPPSWATIFPDGPNKLDDARRQAGAQIFADRCARCHHDKSAGADGFVDYDQEPLTELGTDPNQATGFARPLVGAAGSTPFYQQLAATLDDIEADYFTQYGVSAADQAKWQGGRPNTWRAELSVPMRPLAGVWAVAPYLHNNSVPTLYQLLLPPRSRPTKFKVGDRRYDLHEVGYVWQLDASTTDPNMIFDTSEPGNSNAGHDYGTDLTDEQRWQLIEYLKSL